MVMSDKPAHPVTTTKRICDCGPYGICDCPPSEPVRISENSEIGVALIRGARLIRNLPRGPRMHLFGVAATLEKAAQDIRRLQVALENIMADPIEATANDYVEAKDAILFLKEVS